MPAYTQGNLAVKERVVIPQPQRTPETRKAVKTGIISPREKLLYLGAIAVFAIVSGFIIYRYASIYQMNKEILDTKTAISKLQEENSMLKQKLDAANNPEALKQTAAKSGLTPTKEENKVRIAQKANKSGEVALKSQ